MNKWTRLVPRVRLTGANAGAKKQFRGSATLLKGCTSLQFQVVHEQQLRLLATDNAWVSQRHNSTSRRRCKGLHSYSYYKILRIHNKSLKYLLPISIRSSARARIFIILYFSKLTLSRLIERLQGSTVWLHSRRGHLLLHNALRPGQIALNY